MQISYPRMIIGNHATDGQIRHTGDGVHNELLYLSNKTIGTGNETLTIDADQNCLLMGPVVINCSLTIKGNMKVI